MKLDTETYLKILDNSSEGIIIVNQNKIFTFWNKSAEKLLGYTAKEMLGKNCTDNQLGHLILKNSTENNICPLLNATQKPTDTHDKMYLRHKNGYQIAVIVKTMSLFDEQDNLIGAVELINKNIPAEQENKIRLLAKTAYYDSVTGLLNQAYAEMRLNTILDEMKLANAPVVGILLIQLTTLNDINKQHSSLAGDRALKVMASTLSNSIEEPDLVCRWIGSQFIILSMNSKKSVLLLLANKYKILLEQSTIDFSNVRLPIQVAIGGALAEPIDISSRLIGKAQRALAESMLTNNRSVIIDM